MTTHCRYVVRIEVNPSSEEEWARWQSGHHVPLVLAEPGFLGARMFKDTAPASDGWPRYVVHYDLESREAFERYTTSEGARRLREEHVQAYGYVTRISREVLEQTHTFGAGAQVANPADETAPVGR